MNFKRPQLKHSSILQSNITRMPSSLNTCNDSPNPSCIDTDGWCMSKMNPKQNQSCDAKRKASHISDRHSKDIALSDSASKRNGNRRIRQKIASKETKASPNTSTSAYVDSIDSSLKGLNFAKRLRRVLDNQATSSTIRWQSHGLSFKVFEIDNFEQKILPKYFKKKCKYWSFTRRLGRWGFRRITHGAESGSYHHPLFKRDVPDLMATMKCLTFLEEQRSRATIVTSTSPTERGNTDVVGDKVKCLTFLEEQRSRATIVMPTLPTERGNTDVVGDKVDHSLLTATPAGSAKHSGSIDAVSKVIATVASVSDSAKTNTFLKDHPPTLRTTDAQITPQRSQSVSSTGLQPLINPMNLRQQLERNNHHNSVNQELLQVTLAIESERSKLRLARINGIVQNHVVQRRRRQEILEMLQRISSHNQSNSDQNPLSRTVLMSQHDLPRMLDFSGYNLEHFPIQNLFPHHNVNPVFSLPFPRSSHHVASDALIHVSVPVSHQQDLTHNAQVQRMQLELRLHPQFQLSNMIASANRSTSTIEKPDSAIQGTHYL